MNKLKEHSGTIKAAGIVAVVLIITGALALVAVEKNERGFLGVSVQRLECDEREELGVKYGVQVVGVEQESAAAKAGIIKGDVIQSVNDEKVRDPQTLVEVVRELAAGSMAKIGLWRDGKMLEVKAVLGKFARPRYQAGSAGSLKKIFHSGPYLGVNIMDLDDGDLASYFGVKAGEGILVTSVGKETPAAKAGLKPGDVIVQVGKQAVQESGDIHTALAELKKGDSIAITVVRRGKKETFKAAPDFEHCRHIMRFFDGGKGIGCPGMPCPPDVPDVDRIMERANEKLDRAMIKVDRCLKKIGDNYWI